MRQFEVARIARPAELLDLRGSNCGARSPCPIVEHMKARLNAARLFGRLGILPALALAVSALALAVDDNGGAARSRAATGSGGSAQREDGDAGSAAPAAQVDALAPWGLPRPTSGQRWAVERRLAYWNAFDVERNSAAWSAWRVGPADLDTPPRRGRLAAFQAARGVSPSDYTNSGFARGHLAGFAFFGGDYDGDGLTAAGGDEQDLAAIREANRMDNIAPQHQAGLNGSAGVWNEIERWIREKARSGAELHVVAGVVPGLGPPAESVGGKVPVPPAFYFVVAQAAQRETEARRGDEGLPRRPASVVAFLVPHHRVARKGLAPFVVAVDVVEHLAGVDVLPLAGEAGESLDNVAAVE